MKWKKYIEIESTDKKDYWTERTMGDCTEGKKEMVMESKERANEQKEIKGDCIERKKILLN